ncbi:MAG TPA: TetR/AcrR family transcriptional regulator [Streptosporangiaceae bacterium]|jgi:AcrR family transcriptional regulator
MKSAKRATPRERAHASTLSEARAIASRQLAEGGIEALSLKSVAVELGLTGPAMYRYFASRSELLTEVILGAYGDVAAALSAAAQVTRSEVAAERLLAVASAYRRWALEQPHLFRLLYVAPVPGYDANAARLVDAATACMEVILSLFDQAIAERGAQRGPCRAMAEPPADAASRGARHGHDPEAVQRGVITWTRLYGFIRLEIEGAFQSMGLDADSLYRREVEELTTALGRGNEDSR